MASTDKPTNTIHESRRLRAFLFAFLFFLTVGIEVSGMALVNVMVDPRSEFGNPVLRPLILNDVEIKLDHYAALDASPTTVVFGSSRAMTIDPRVLEGLGLGPTFNFALLPSTPMDEALLYNWMLLQGDHPTTVIVGIELDQVQPGRELRWQIQTSERLGPLTGEAPSIPERVGKAYQTLEQGYLRDTLKTILYAAVGQPPAENVFEPNGRVARPLDRVEFENGTLDAASRIDLDHPLRWIQRYEDYELPSLHAAEAVAQLVSTAKRENATIVLLMTPLQPELFTILEPIPEFQRNQNALREILLIHCGVGVQVFDYTDVRTFGGNGRDFFDAHHYLNETADGIANGIASRQGQLC